jgi:hypothetical protein
LKWMIDSFRAMAAFSSFLSCLTFWAIIMHYLARLKLKLALLLHLVQDWILPPHHLLKHILMPFMSGPSSQKMIFAFDHFDEFCAPQGIHLNLSKSMILSTLDPTTKPIHHTVLQQALSKLPETITKWSCLSRYPYW